MSTAHSRATDTTGVGAGSNSTRVWDIAVRVFHWSLVAAFAAAWLTGDEAERFHEWSGYAAAGLVGFRLIWGVIGTRHARFSSFVRGPRVVVAYLGDIIAGRERRYLGHNPVGGAMILALLAGVLGLALTGAMMSMDTFWGSKWVEEVHEAIANTMLALVALHVGGVILASLRHSENLVKAMFDGRKRTE